MPQTSFQSIASWLPLVAFIVLFLLQSLLPRRDLTRSGSLRMVHNLLLFGFNAVLLRLLIPLSLVVCAQWAIEHQTGFFNLWQPTLWLIIVLSVVLLDCAVYWQHVATHKFPLLWRLHKVHHADHDMDVSTATRFHPIELLLSLLYKGAVVILLGVPVLAVVIFELLLFIGPAFNHSNLRLPIKVDKALRYFIATPDMHRVHHSVIVAEQNTNYGFFLSWWDKLFGTYTEQPQQPHPDLAIGIKGVGIECEHVVKMLSAPLKNW